MRTIALLSISLTLLVVSSVASALTPPPKESPDTAALVKGANDFALKLYSAVAAKEQGNLFLSPASIHAALTMTSAGAAGQTAEQMNKTLELPKDGSVHAAYGALLQALNDPRKDHQGHPVYNLSMVNALWVQQGFALKPAFVKTLGDDYKAEPRQLDFAKSEPARKTINDWVAKQTKDKIKDLIPAGVLNAMTRLVLTNAVYFKSRWMHEFAKTMTKDGPFHAAGKDVQAPLMYQQEEYAYAETDTLQLVKLPYLFHELSMVILLPKANDGLPALEKSLTAEALEGYLKQVQSEEVQLTLPKFKFDSQLGPADVLKAMGMTDAFSDKADFSGITEREKLYISAVLHKAFVAVDEEGTEAAAATAVVMAAMAAPGEERPPKVFKADHPFLFLIRHEQSGAILFIGRVTDPGAK